MQPDSIPMRAVRPPRLPRYRRYAVCPNCSRGGQGDTTVCSYVDEGDGPGGRRRIGCGYCGYNGPDVARPLETVPVTRALLDEVIYCLTDEAPPGRRVRMVRALRDELVQAW